MKILIPFLLALVLTACGGGGGGSSSTTNTSVDSIKLSYNAENLAFSPRLSYANFGSGVYAVMSGIYLGPNSTGAANPDAPLKVFKLTASGFEDATVQILGSNTTAPGNAVIADFNGDGIDDIFTGYLKDYPSTDSQGNAHTGNSVVFLSNPGHTHTRILLPGLVWTHQSIATDIDSDGDIDVINSQGKMWLNDGHGNFTFKDHDWNTSTHWMNGSGVCAGDFTNNGRTQLVLTDQMVDPQLGPIADTVLFDLDNMAEPIALHSMPTPLLDVGNSGAERSHDVGCTTVDVNHDGLMDIVVFSRSWEWVTGTWNTPGTMQLLLNQGNYQFVDATASILGQTSSPAAYTYVTKDFNNDGTVDLLAGTQLFMSSNTTLIARALPNMDADSILLMPVTGGYKILSVKDEIGRYTVSLTNNVVNF